MKKRLVSSLLVATMLIGLAGCGSNDESENMSDWSKDKIIQTYSELVDSYDALNTEYETLKNMNQALSSADTPSDSIALTGDGTGRFNFHSVDSKIIFPQSFQYPDSTAIESDGYINIVGNIKVSTGSNWITKLNGSTLELEHSSGISGTIKACGIRETYDATVLQDEVLSRWFDNMKDDDVTYKNIFMNGTAIGVQASTQVMIDSETAYLRCGMLGYGEYSLTYIFVYRGAQDATKDESITSVLNSIKINDNAINQ